LELIDKFCTGLKNDFKYLDFGTVNSTRKQSKVGGKLSNQHKVQGKRVEFGRTFLHYFLLIFKLWPVKIIIGIAIMMNFLKS